MPIIPNGKTHHVDWFLSAYFLQMSLGLRFPSTRYHIAVVESRSQEVIMSVLDIPISAFP
jgi:hypothetical protein